MVVIMMTHLPHKPHAPHITTTRIQPRVVMPTMCGGKIPWHPGKVPEKGLALWERAFGFRSSRIATKMHANEFQLRPTDKMSLPERCVPSETVFIFIDMESSLPAFGCRRFCCQFA